MGITWLTAMLDTRAEDAAASETFWAAVTGWPVGARRGVYGEFATLEPTDGDGLLRVQVVGEPVPGGIHLDLHCDDVEATAVDVRRLGGFADPHQIGYLVCQSPGGMVFCLVHHQETKRPHAQRWPKGDSLVDQVCLDIPGSRFEVEADFWSVVTGWPRRHGGRPEFDYLLRPPGQPLRILLQRVDEGAGTPVRAHLDLAAEHRDAEVERHLALDARFFRREQHWTTLIDPVGRDYCVTDRDPETGTLP